MCKCVGACVCVCVCMCVSVSVSVSVYVSVSVCTSIQCKGFMCLDRLDSKGTDQKCCAKDVSFLCQVPSLLL